MTTQKPNHRELQAEHEPRLDQEQREFLRAFAASDYVETDQAQAN